MQALFAIVPAVPVAHPQLARESVIPAPDNYRIRYGVNGRHKPGQAAAAAFDADPRIHIVAFSTSSSQGLLSAWLGWMAAMAAADPRHGYEIHAVTEPMLDTPGSGSFQDDLWFRANIRKIHVLLQVARGLPTGTAVIQTDLDVVPIRPYSLLPFPSVGMSFAVENSGGCNGGVNVLRVGVQTLEMLDRWIHAKGRMFYPFADQSALNKLGLCNLSLTLPERFVSLGNLTRIGFGSKTIMFHAVESVRLVVRSAQCCVPRCFGRRCYCLPSHIVVLTRTRLSFHSSPVFPPRAPRCIIKLPLQCHITG